MTQGHNPAWGRTNFCDLGMKKKLEFGIVAKYLRVKPVAGLLKEFPSCLRLRAQYLDSDLCPKGQSRVARTCGIWSV